MTTPKRVRVPKERVPYRDRIPAVLEFCTCLWAHHTNEDGTTRARIHNVDPKCVLHGPNAQPSPF